MVSASFYVVLYLFLRHCEESEARRGNPHLHISRNDNRANERSTDCHDQFENWSRNDVVKMPNFIKGILPEKTLLFSPLFDTINKVFEKEERGGRDENWLR